MLSEGQQKSEFQHRQQAVEPSSVCVSEARRRSPSRCNTRCRRWGAPCYCKVSHTAHLASIRAKRGCSHHVEHPHILEADCCVHIFDDFSVELKDKKTKTPKTHKSRLLTGEKQQQLQNVAAKCPRCLAATFLVCIFQERTCELQLCAGSSRAFFMSTTPLENK